MIETLFLLHPAGIIPFTVVVIYCLHRWWKDS